LTKGRLVDRRQKTIVCPTWSPRQTRVSAPRPPACVRSVLHEISRAEGPSQKAWMPILPGAVLLQDGGYLGKAILFGGGQRRDAGLGSGVDVGSARRQQFHHHGPAPGGGQIKRSGTGFGIAGLAGVHIGALVEEQRGQFAPPVQGGIVQRCRTIPIARIDIGSVL